ncbi:MAG: transcription antiterminator NusG [Mesorhizobium sp.]|nr:MAG: transcription antiterminator NusG [Mesorhizobium sp.]TIL32569.1 MAG: transcription antiterminator NusG [Mesorhizobium sp.]TIL92106.1 MAG: transcription antiterminator NusG [Mesorhizobium sp.]TIM16087.1 MAG: transcription antiterminator NusG [Mesorhizobium sp.]TIN41853.1 MAG: transcription antiterminator NusG [Mesorhizobium sp.]
MPRPCQRPPRRILVITSKKTTVKATVLPQRPATGAAARWYAASVFPGKEDVAERHLRIQGFRPFIPRCERTIRHARRVETRPAAYFPGYMFIALDVALQRWRSVNGTFGVRSLIMQGERPLPVPSGLVERFIALTDKDGLLDFSGGLTAGASVRILSGPFAEMIGRLDRLDPAGRARVLVAIMNGEIPVDLDSRELVAIA